MQCVKKQNIGSSSVEHVALALPAWTYAFQVYAAYMPGAAAAIMLGNAQRPTGSSDVALVPPATPAASSSALAWAIYQAAHPTLAALG